MKDGQLEELLREALPPTEAGASTGKTWSRLSERLDQGPRWSWIDFGLATAVAISLLLSPEWLWLLVYHL